ncbi:MAG: 4Fe-4S binding protein [Deltaproteobacteria bacterium]|nr:4Fe-4S binding protein [Deltaproteobacteria bacterium]
MIKQSPSSTIVLFILLIVIVIGLSLLSDRIWGGKAEKLPKPDTLIIEKGMTITQFGQANAFPNQVLKTIFDLQTKSDLDNKLEKYGTSDQISMLVLKKLALASEHSSKNWIKILVKFVLWAFFLGIVYLIFNRRKITPQLRKWLLFAAVLIFGVGLGSDPSPMGTVKDAIHLYGTTGAIFPPRMIALTVFLVFVFLVNKYICAWGCQVGALQDLIFHINRTDKHKAVIGRQIKLPFVLTNTLRIAFLGLFTLVAFLWGFDIIEPIDPFKVFKPEHIVFTGGIFITLLLVAGLFIYRPWCHLFCPFGLVGWLIEKISRVRVSVDYETCIACQKCAAACPSTVMGAILRRDKKTIPDCFSCYTCRDVCPTGSIRFSRDKRTLPPAGHFEKR